jgi:phospholipase/lecithinase/hemolysin
MRILPFRIAIVILGLSLSSVHAEQAESNRPLVVFGDSLSDNGNAAAALAAAGLTLGNYAANAATDGPATTPATSGPFGLWVDQFAALTSLADPEPFLVSPSLGILTVNYSATNFAVGSALAGNNPNFSPTGFLAPGYSQVPGTTNQVGLFLAFNGGHASRGNLYVFWAGANNIYAALDSPATFLTFPNVAKSAADAIAADTVALASAGGNHFLWLNLPPLGQVPSFNDNPNLLDRILGKAAANDAALIFNAELAADAAFLKLHYGIEIKIVDTHSLFNSIASHPGKFGFVNVKDAAWCGPDGLATCASNNPNQFLFWDGEHPTTAANAVLAQFVEKAIE